MTSEQFVWVWLPGDSAPVVCGRVWAERGVHLFQYGRSYLGNPRAIGIFGIPLTNHPVSPGPELGLHGALRDALPDAWGQQVIAVSTGIEEPTEIELMRLSSTDRFGAIDFQDRSDVWTPWQGPASLEGLARATDAIERGETLPASLDAALRHGTSIGGARPKATLIDRDGDSWIAKFSSSSDGRRPVVRREAFALELARRSGINTVEFRLAEAAGRDVLLVRRFDRTGDGGRLMTVSALTILRVHEYAARYSSYPELVDRLRELSSSPEGVGAEMFRRIAANIALGNTDDHARNHAAFWDGKHLRLTPAYDVDPCRTPGWDANQAMAYGREGQRVSNLAELTRQASAYDLTLSAARGIVDDVVGAITTHWEEAADVARLTQPEASRLRGSQVLNPAVLDGLPRTF